MIHRRQIIAVSLLVVVAVFTCFVYLNDRWRETEGLLAEKNGAYGKLQSSFLQQIFMTELPCDTTSKLYYEENGVIENVTLGHLYEEAPRPGVYIDRSQCETCYQRALDFLQKNMTQAGKGRQPIVLLSGFSLRDMQSFKARYRCPFEVYLLEWPLRTVGAIRLDQPFYFLLERAGYLSALFYPEEQYEGLGPLYLERVKTRCGGRDSLTMKGVEAVHPMVDIGTVALRQEVKTVLRIRNYGKKSRRVKSVRTSCNCVMVLEAPQEIAPGEEGQVKVAFLSTTTGVVQREVVVTIEGEPRPCEFHLKAVVR